MTRTLLVAGFLAAALTAQVGLAQTTDATVVEDVIIEGLHTLTPQQIKAQLRTAAGQPYNPAYVQEDLTTLGKMGAFQTPWPKVERVGPNTVKVTFVAREYPNIVREVVYKYNHHTRAEELDGITGIKRGLALNPEKNRQACKDIVDHYKRNGRYFASCTLEEGDKPGDTRVVFNITEGPVVRVRHITFTGNDTLASAARLRTQIDTWQRFLPLLEMASSKYEPKRAEDDGQKLEDYYRSNGYLGARVTREINFSDDHQFVDITYHIAEGLRYKVEDVVIKGTEALPLDQVQSIARVHKGDTYDERAVEADVRNITDLYGHRGYKADVMKDLRSDPAVPGVVRVQYQIIEHKPFKVGEVEIAGNEVTKRRVILRMLNIYPGQTLNFPALRQGERDLARSNLFDMEERPTITPIERVDSFDSEYKDILVRVKETMTGSLMFGASVNSDAGLVGSIVLNERNFDILRPPQSIDDIFEGRAFRGGGQELRIEAVPGTQVQRYSVSFREPFLFDLPYSLTTQAYYFDRSYVEDLESRYGFNVALGHQLNRYWSVSAGLRVENVNISNVPFYAPPDYLSVRGDNFIVAPRVSVSRDDRDSYLRPTEGGLLSFTYEQLLGDATAPILTAEASRYFTVHQRPDGSGRQVVMVRSQLAWAGDETPVYERFYAGGIRSLRGFEFRGVGPIENGFNVGGDFMFLNSIEYQLPVVANDQIYLVAFLDSGTVEKSLAIHDYRVSAGVGARIVVPMLGQVPIALDFGFPIVRGPNDRTQMFSFYVGFFR